MSDLHGCYDQYIKMLKKIQFSESDELYILGDVIDRGKEPIKILLDMAARDNVYAILGNHELLALSVLPALLKEITHQNATDGMSEQDIERLLFWQGEGGNTTLEKLQKLSPDERNYLLEYLREFMLYDKIQVGKNTFILVHAGLGNFTPERPLSDYTAEELTLYRPDPNQCFFTDNTYLICGHTPTKLLCGKAEIYQNRNHIFIDCGAVFGGNLGCLCLETMEEFYV